MDNAIDVYGQNADVTELGGRIRRCIPGGDKLKPEEAIALAQLSVSLGLNPFTGEVWYIPGKGPFTGILGLRRLASRQSDYSVNFRLMTGQERQDHGLADNLAIGMICQLFRFDVLERAVQINKAAGAAVVPVTPILGVGIWKPGDNIAKNKSPRWVAEKRAEADALKRGFGIAGVQFSDEEEPPTAYGAGDGAPSWRVWPEEKPEQPVLTEANPGDGMPSEGEIESSAPFFPPGTWAEFVAAAIARLGYNHEKHIVNTWRQIVGDPAAQVRGTDGRVLDPDALWLALENHKAQAAQP